MTEASDAAGGQTGYGAAVTSEGVFLSHAAWNELTGSIAGLLRQKEILFLVISAFAEGQARSQGRKGRSVDCPPDDRGTGDGNDPRHPYDLRALKNFL